MPCWKVVGLKATRIVLTATATTVIFLLSGAAAARFPGSNSKDHVSPAAGDESDRRFSEAHSSCCFLFCFCFPLRHLRHLFVSLIHPRREGLRSNFVHNSTFCLKEKLARRPIYILQYFDRTSSVTVQYCTVHVLYSISLASFRAAQPGTGELPRASSRSSSRGRRQGRHTASPLLARPAIIHWLVVQEKNRRDEHQQLLATSHTYSA